VNAKIRRRLRNCKRRIQRRLRPRNWTEQTRPMFRTPNIHAEIGAKTQGLHCGGLAAFQLLVQRLGLASAIDQELHLFCRHVPYFESDHICNLVFNILADGTTLTDIELLRNNENYLNALGTQRIPDPTTAGDFLRRFTEADIETLLRVINEQRLKVWRQQPDSFFEQAIIEADGTLAATDGECKQGMDIAYNGVWGYHPLIVSLANTQEPLFLVNRSGNRPSHEGAAERFDQAIDLCRRAGFRQIVLRGDTDFALTAHFDRWDTAGVRFVFGLDAMPNLREIVEDLPRRAWQPLPRPAKYRVATTPRQRPAKVKEELVRQKEFENIRLVSEQVAEFEYRPGKCRQNYRVVVVRKNLSVEKGERVLFDDIRYFFYITNDRDLTAAEVVYFANDRCNQENLIEQLKNGIRALRMPTHDLVSNWAYMVIASLAWSLKAWLALVQPKAENRQVLLRMEFRSFLRWLVLIPCQLVHTGRRLVYRLLSWNPWVPVLLETVSDLRRLQFV
jgi:Transposase DDE domain group 1